jgi:transposase
MAHSITVVAGIDVGKDGLDVALVPTGEVVHVANSPAGRRELAGWLGRREVGRVGLEASGGYERPVCEMLRRAGFEVALLQPRQVRAFAHYKLRRAKNDRIDAGLIAEAAASLEGVREAPDPRLEAFAEHLRLIEQIELDLARLRTRLEAYHDKRLLRWLRAEIVRLERRHKAELALLSANIARHADLARRLALIESIDGIGHRTGLTLVILMPELGRLTRAQIASLAGLAPYDRNSGNFTGLRRIKGGRARVRKALYAAALPASFQWNQALKTFYGRLRDRGKTHKQALVACARKLLIYANTVLQRDSEWVKTAPTT